LDSVPVGSTDPYGLKVVLRSRTLDLTQASGGAFRVKRSDGSTVEWAAALQNQTIGAVEVVRVFQAGDLPTVENLQIEVSSRSLERATSGAGRTILRVVPVI